jgi:hypothetical protein
MKLNPAKRTGGVLVDVCHSGKSLHQVGLAGCQREMKAKTAESAKGSWYFSRRAYCVVTGLGPVKII